MELQARDLLTVTAKKQAYEIGEQAPLFSVMETVTIIQPSSGQQNPALFNADINFPRLDTGPVGEIKRKRAKEKP